MTNTAAALLEIQYFPPVQYFAKFLQYETIFIEQHENYQKGGYRNRCYIATGSGVQMLTVPLLKGKNQQMPIREVRIDNHCNWVSQHLHAIRTAYGKAPFFEEYADRLFPLLEKRYEFLFDLDWRLLETCLELASIPLRPRLTSWYEKDTAPGIADLRNAISPKAERQGTDPGFIPAFYPQVFMERHGFLPNLSILDLLFCCGPEAHFLIKNSIASNP